VGIEIAIDKLASKQTKKARCAENQLDLVYQGTVMRMRQHGY
jgi:hypothetical protein